MLRRIYRDFKRFDGGVLKHKDPIKRRTYYFEMDFKLFDSIYKSLKKKNCLYVLSSNHTCEIFDSLNQIKNRYSLENIYPGIIFRNGKITYSVLSKVQIIELLKNMNCPEKDNNLLNNEEHERFLLSNFGFKQTSNFVKSKDLETKQKVSKHAWDEKFNDGLELFEDDEIDAEAYADSSDR